MTVPRYSRIRGPRLAAPLGPLDPRDHAWRADLADLALHALVAVPNYIEPLPMVASRQTMMFGDPRGAGEAVSELLPGEGFAMLDCAHGFAWGYSLADHYVGHVAMEALEEPGGEAGRRVGPGDALLFRQPSIKAEVAMTLPAGAIVHPGDVHPEDVHSGDGADSFVQLQAGPGSGLYLHRRHLLDDTSPDWVDIAMGFLGSPYRWGGRSRAGIDCSGLVQVARQLAGHRCRRDSDMILADAAIAPTADSAARGDLCGWPGHVGLLVDRHHLLHANAHHMSTVIEPLADVVARAESPPRFRRF